ncbi:uncharacterized protein AMSG_05315 [Thecamonas trahens ATCC 50062]|uniref:Uncharacterized protein n=1 Tax=Thecamonas trahens ATCC 50062 TaxID=461836 RepID=A0A0L0DDB1_THETB|nr:hypothetical protein AMSG_05315 [Thecamonas trahens ATCC 50062]KNC49318.1 hypothetical protein AMSG_05315 [Thecamonas trahens ATCC 50062]|eukprot:XP_013758026.1 hypothetical protein AMSG_05315 [Thecamonas trahens ATCC 50062]
MSAAPLRRRNRPSAAAKPPLTPPPSPLLPHDLLPYSPDSAKTLPLPPQTAPLVRKVASVLGSARAGSRPSSAVARRRPATALGLRAGRDARLQLAAGSRSGPPVDVDIDAFLDLHRRTAKSSRAARRIQQWWRATVRRLQLVTAINDRVAATAAFLRPVFSAWVQAVVSERANRLRLMSKAFRALEFQVVYNRQRYKCTEVFLAMQASNPVFKLAGVSIDSGSRVHRVIVAFRAMIQLRTTRNVIQHWYQWVQMRKRRAAAIQHAMVLLRDAYSVNFAGLTFVMWYRYAHMRAAERAGAPHPTFAEPIPEWDAFLDRYHKQSAAVMHALTAASSLHLRRAFSAWHRHTAAASEARTRHATAVAFNSRNLWSAVWPYWRAHTLDSRARRWKLGRWFHKLKVEMRRRTAGDALTHRHALLLKHVAWKRLKAWLRHRRLGHLAARALILAPTAPRATLLFAVYALGGPRFAPRLTLIKVFRAWAAAARRVVLFNKFKVAHVLERRRSLTVACFYALSPLGADAVMFLDELTRTATSRDAVVTIYTRLLAGEPPEPPALAARIAAAPLAATTPGAAPANVIKILRWRREVIADAALGSDPILLRKLAVLAVAANSPSGPSLARERVPPRDHWETYAWAADVAGIDSLAALEDVWANAVASDNLVLAARAQLHARDTMLLAAAQVHLASMTLAQATPSSARSPFTASLATPVMASSFSFSTQRAGDALDPVPAIDGFGLVATSTARDRQRASAQRRHLGRAGGRL